MVFPQSSPPFFLVRPDRPAAPARRVMGSCCCCCPPPEAPAPSPAPRPPSAAQGRVLGLDPSSGTRDFVVIRNAPGLKGVCVCVCVNVLDDVCGPLFLEFLEFLQKKQSTNWWFF